MKFTSKIEVEKRKDLKKVIPLLTPYVIQIDPVNICNFRCIFCPSGDPELVKKKKKGFMDYKLYKKIIDDLMGFENNIRCIKLWKDGEPLLNSKISDMISYAKNANIADKIELTTNGSLLNESLSKQLINAGLDRIIISLEGLSEEDYKKHAQVDINFDDFINNIRFFFKNRKHCIVHIKSIDVNLSEQDKQKFYNIFKDIADEISIEKAVPCWPGFDCQDLSHTELNIWGENLLFKDICPLPFYHLAINAKGTIGVCCNDWEEKIVVGNALTDNIVDVWDGELLHYFQRLQLEKRRKSHPVCASCLFPDFVAVDYLDDYSEAILSKFNRKFYAHK